MAIRRPCERKAEIDLDGPDGNAFVLIGYAAQFANQLGLDKHGIIADMKSGDYRHLIEVFDRHFGEVVDLVSTNYTDDGEDHAS